MIEELKQAQESLSSLLSEVVIAQLSVLLMAVCVKLGL